MVCDLVEEALRSAFGPGFVVRGQKPVVAGDRSEPEPDVYVVRGRVRDLVRHPSSPVLVVEVSDSSVAFDLITKAAVYARGGFEEYWVIVIPERMLVIHRDPDTDAGEYLRVERHDERAAVAPLQSPASLVRVADLLP
jgi:Uma2 family endonuclease